MIKTNKFNDEKIYIWVDLLFNKSVMGENRSQLRQQQNQNAKTVLGCQASYQNLNQ